MATNVVFYALNREDARQIFGCRTPESLLEFVQKIGANPDVLQVAAGETAFALHRALTGGDDPAAGEYPLNHVVLGGRPLASAEQFTVVLKRPDIVTHLVAALQNVTLDDPVLADVAQKLSSLYQAAAAAGSAVILVKTT